MPRNLARVRNRARLGFGFGSGSGLEFGLGLRLGLGWGQIRVRNLQMLMRDYEIAQRILEITQIDKSRAKCIATVTVEPIVYKKLCCCRGTVRGATSTEIRSSWS